LHCQSSATVELRRWRWGCLYRRNSTHLNSTSSWVELCRYKRALSSHAAGPNVPADSISHNHASVDVIVLMSFKVDIVHDVSYSAFGLSRSAAMMYQLSINYRSDVPTVRSIVYGSQAQHWNTGHAVHCATVHTHSLGGATKQLWSSVCDALCRAEYSNAVHRTGSHLQWKTNRKSIRVFD